MIESLELINRLVSKIRNSAVAAVAFTAALSTAFIVPPDKAYLGYFDLKTLTCLFCVLAVVCALRNISFFTLVAREIVSVFKNARLCVLSLIYITFLGSMLIANDMALLTFLPLGYFVLTSTGKEKYMAYTFILQNVAANLGGMLTPFGNPQNLYLYSKFHIGNGEFVRIMLPPFIVAIAVITLCCLFIKKEPVEITASEKISLPPLKTAIYILLFALSIAIVFRGIPYWTGLAVIPAALFFLDREALRQVDYQLLLTFACFFVFAGNMARIAAVRDFFGYFLGKSTLICSVLSCQAISNVPSAILLSQFTADYRSLLIGVNIGGVGTLIASLASLITFREYQKHNPKRIKQYIGLFSAVNFGLLIILTGFAVALLT